MIQVVFDTDIYVSAFFWGGPPREALDMARSGAFQLKGLVTELLEVLSRSKFAARLKEIGETPHSLLDNYMQSLVLLIEPATITPAVLKDADDDLVLACALGGKVHYIVSGDSHLLNLGEFHQIPEVTIARFLALIRSEN